MDFDPKTLFLNAGKSKRTTITISTAMFSAVDEFLKKSNLDKSYSTLHFMAIIIDNFLVDRVAEKKIDPPVGFEEEAESIIKIRKAMRKSSNKT